MKNTKLGLLTIIAATVLSANAYYDRDDYGPHTVPGRTVDAAGTVVEGTGRAAGGIVTGTGNFLGRAFTGKSREEREQEEADRKQREEERLQEKEDRRARRNN